MKFEDFIRQWEGCCDKKRAIKIWSGTVDSAVIWFEYSCRIFEDIERDKDKVWENSITRFLAKQYKEHNDTIMTFFCYVNSNFLP